MIPDAPRPLGPWEERMARFLYGLTGGTLVVRREAPAPGGAVLDAVGRTVLHPPFDLRLHDGHGGHPLEGGTLTFGFLRVRMDSSTVESVRFRSRLAQIYLRTVDLRLSEGGGGTALEVTADLDREVRMGVRWYVVPVAVLGALLGVLGITLVPHPWAEAWGGGPQLAILGAVAGALASVGLFRWFCRMAVRWAREGLEKMLDAVVADLTAPGPPSEPPAVA